jgi:hypothetical protein
MGFLFFLQRGRNGVTGGELSRRTLHLSIRRLRYKRLYGRIQGEIWGEIAELTEQKANFAHLIVASLVED